MTQQRTGPGPVLRLSVERRGRRWSVTGRTVVPEMTVPAGQDLPAAGQAAPTGLWFEVVDAEGEVLYRRALAAPVEGVEVHGPDGAMQRVAARPDRWGTDLRVPLLPGASVVRLFHVGERSGEGKKGRPSGLVLEETLTDLPKGR